MGILDPLRRFGTLAELYFGTLSAPFATGALSIIPASGAVCLIAGIALAVVKRETGVIWAVLGVILSHILMSLTGLMSGLVFLPFLAVQLGISILVVGSSKRSPLAGALIAWFNISYALAAAFLAAMSLPGAAL
jgi:hypothetical protein